MSLILDGTNGLSDIDGSAATPAIRGTDTNTGIFFPAADTIAFSEGGVESMRIDASGNMGQKVTPSPWATYSVLQQANGSLASVGTQTQVLQNAYFDGSNMRYITSNGASRYGQDVFGGATHYWYNAPSGTAGNVITFTQTMTLKQDGNNTYVNFGCTGLADAAQLYTGFSSTSSYFAIGTKNSGTLAERARIDSSGNLLVGKTSVDNNPGIALRPTGEGYFVRSGADVLSVNRLSSDGQLVVFYQDTVPEGNISVSGTTVSYNGGHLSRYAQTTTAKDDSIVKGTVLSNLDEMNVYTKDGQPVDNEQLNKVKVSDIEGDANVAGVFVNWSHDEQHNVDEINMAMTGDMIIRIAQGVTVVRGDLLMSAGDGTAKPQGDDIVRSKTVAKVTSNHITCTYADGSYCVPCVLMAC